MASTLENGAPEARMRRDLKMRRRRYQSGSLKQRCDKWIGQWWEGERRKNRVLGPVATMTKSAAHAALNKILADLKASEGKPESNITLGQFIENIYYPFYKRKWKGSTAVCNVQRVNTHVVSTLGARLLTDFRRNDLQAFLDEKGAAGFSFSVVDHLRWDLRQIFEMGVSEGLIDRNPAKLLFTPSEAKVGEQKAMTLEAEVKAMLSMVLDLRERLVVQLAIIAGMRPGEILGLTWKARWTELHRRSAACLPGPDRQSEVQAIGQEGCSVRGRHDRVRPVEIDEPRRQSRLVGFSVREGRSPVSR